MLIIEIALGIVLGVILLQNISLVIGIFMFVVWVVFLPVIIPYYLCKKLLLGIRNLLALALAPRNTSASDECLSWDHFDLIFHKAVQGDCNAQCSLGKMYERGEGVLRDGNEAVKWYRLAAEQGDDHAQRALGFIYANGRGVPIDYFQAYIWYDIVASKGDEYAIKFRDDAAGRMTHTQLTQAQEMARKWKPIKAGIIQ
ncbi:tetratricopeptide repeat protein [Candidatus Magnetaquicoccus inordinatus]|uniref:tetratricopeptide repeat protein n=1 Tax=Candidatus Magnetaquicoccus inordinatus TaxID=2496818 RepID=UPI00102C4580|nr:tetratricopeptide repeat protein [Candidatus Magnetaquicoccus inordinatus]